MSCSAALAETIPGIEAREDTVVRAVDVYKVFSAVKPGDVLRLLRGQEAREEGYTALNGVTLSVPRGKILGVLGRNGAGKSTLLRVLAGVYQPSAGTVSVDGEAASLFELGGMGTRFITGREYADRYLRIQGVRRAEIPRMLEDIREFSELGDFFDRMIFTYSSGMAARLYFAVATSVRKDVYLIDELLSVGDEHFKAKCWHRIRGLLGHGASGVLVTHDWSAVVKLCEESLVLDRGRIVDAGRSDQVVARYLALSPPEGGAASFGALPESFRGRAGQDLRVGVPVRVSRECQLEFAFSIEMLRLGVGWEVMLLSHFHHVDANPGAVTVGVEVPRLPLPRGRYSLNLFLRERRKDGSTLECDARTWTNGNGCALFVDGGESSSALAKIPVHWTSRPIHDARN